MKNIIDYAKNELRTFNEKKFNSIDSLILSQISYIVLDGLVNNIDGTNEAITFKDLLKAEFFYKMFNTIPYSKSTKELLFHISANPRFRDIKINYYISKIDKFSEKQFSATTFILDNTYAYVAFRGTDYSIVGWKEDFNMAFITPIPSQLEGVKYLNTIAKLIPHRLYVGGHSKGGNIAVYASMNCEPDTLERIEVIFSHDGPGFRADIIESNNFKKIQNKINKTIPYSSLIGMFLENHEEYNIVKSNKFSGLKQHDPLSWEIKNSDFIYLEKISQSSKYTYKALHKWLSEVDNEKRKIFIDALFSIFTSTKEENFIEISKNLREYMPLMIYSIKNMDKEIKSLIIKFIKEFTSLYIKVATHIEK